MLRVVVIVQDDSVETNGWTVVGYDTVAEFVDDSVGLEAANRCMEDTAIMGKGTRHERLVRAKMRVESQLRERKLAEAEEARLLAIERNLD